jgi:hypothetical protein
MWCVRMPAIDIGREHLEILDRVALSGTAKDVRIHPGLHVRVPNVAMLIY